MPQIVAPPKTDHHITTCPHCKYTISYMEDEVERVDNESIGVYCPNCRDVIETGKFVPFTFPDSFFHYDNKAEKLSDDEVQKHINIVKRILYQECKDGEYYYSGAGDTMVFGFKSEDEISIYVAKNCWEDSVYRE